MDYEFIRRAERVTTFNVTSADFQSLKYKQEIQSLFKKYFFPNFDLTQTINDVNAESLNDLINDLRRQDRDMLNKLVLYPLKGVGPGEIMLFFLINTAFIGGMSSAGVDLFVGDSKYEVKGVIERNGFATDFMLGSNVPLAEVMTELHKLLWRCNISAPLDQPKLPGTKTSISGKTCATMKELAPDWYRNIETEYARLAYDHYFANHPVIFVNSSAVNRVGLIEKIKYVQKDDILIERLSNGSVKPRIRL